MDEATSALDRRIRTEGLRQRHEYLNDRTVFLITCLSTIRQADMIVMLHEGVVVEVGTHDELMSRRGRCNLYRTREFLMRMNPQKFGLFNRATTSWSPYHATCFAISIPLLLRTPLIPTVSTSQFQQGRFWMRTVTWTLVGSGVFSVAWLALARTEEIVVAPGQLSSGFSTRDPDALRGVTDQIMVKEGDLVKAGQVLMKLDTKPAKNSITVWRRQSTKQEQLMLKQEENATQYR